MFSTLPCPKCGSALSRASRREMGFSPTSTMRLAPVESKWLSSVIGVFILCVRFNLARNFARIVIRVKRRIIDGIELRTAFKPTAQRVGHQEHTADQHTGEVPRDRAAS